ncbi:multicopper oxidase domain-containing protein, partial [Moorena sp. SIO2C4]|uniref:multicopper oxidase domain-containing protein n=1 Tax=Moorena sp. SIO2C4 TaxID=2607824 RepID=UPI0013C61FF9
SELPTYEGCEAKDGSYICPLLPQGYRDVINLPPNSTTTVRIPFVNPFITGPFVYHCHILNHEDKGMMNNLKVVNTKGYGGEEVVPQKAQIQLR